MSFMSGVEKKIKTFNDIALIFLMTVIALLIFIQVLFRYVLHIPMHFVEEILILAAVWLYLLGSVNASREESHINARVLEIFIGKVINCSPIDNRSATSPTSKPDRHSIGIVLFKLFQCFFEFYNKRT